MAATKAVLAEVCTPEATQDAIDRNRRYLDACDAIIAERALPAHTVQFGAKGCITWSPDPVRNYDDVAHGVDVLRSFVDALVA